KKIALAKSLHDDPSNSIGDICEVLDISKSTLYRYLEED
ncbi:ArsR family transcriptional regulator, partial [Candidatus Marinimicrobia bacterium MT.SAG.2]